MVFGNLRPDVLGTWTLQAFQQSSSKEYASNDISCGLKLPSRECSLVKHSCKLWVDVCLQALGFDVKRPDLGGLCFCLVAVASGLGRGSEI